jgi:segregation and condensation protein A
VTVAVALKRPGSAAADATSSRPVQLELHLETFDGPLELLLLLVEQRRLPITSVSLAQVADQYLTHVHAQPNLDTELLAEFLVIGGKLLLLKSRALLLTETVDPEVEEVASDLADRLATYRVFRAAAEALRDLEARGERMYPTVREPLLTTIPPELLPVTPNDLLNVWRRFLAGARPAQVELPGLARASVEERRARILDALRATARVSFRALAGSTVDEVVATFLAVLELFRRGQIDVAQDTPFGDLELRPPA